MSLTVLTMHWLSRWVRYLRRARRVMVPAVCLAGFGLGAAEPLIVAHRGASHDAPENTLAAFRLAFQQGADAIEGDFYLSRDGHLVCLHDADTARVAGARWVVTNSTLAELRALEVGAWKGPQWRGEKIPTAAEVLAVVPPDKMIFIEIKGGRECVPALAQALAQSPLQPKQVKIIAFKADVIAESKRRLPQLQAFWLTAFKQEHPQAAWKPGRAEILATLKRVRADGLDCQAHAQADEALFQALAAAGYPLHVWTVDKPEEAARYARLGVASITTNRPEYLRKVLAGLNR